MLKKTMSFIARLLGLTTKDDLGLLKTELQEIRGNFSALERDFFVVKGNFETLSRDMKTLYSEVSSDIVRVDRKVKAVKPTLKIQDPESEKFIRDILSKHDARMVTYQNALQSQMNSVREAKNLSESALAKAQSGLLSLENTLSALGIGRFKEEARDEAVRVLREIITQKVLESKERNVSN